MPTSTCTATVPPGRCSGSSPSTAGPTPARNPAAIYRDPMTMDDYMTARPITTPFGLYDCDVPCDGSIAVVVSDASVAGDLPGTAIRVEAVGTQILERVSWDQGTLTHEPQVLGQAAHLWTRTEPPSLRRGSRPRLRRLHLQRRLVARGARVLSASARPRIGSTGDGGSRWTASSRSTPTAASSAKAGPTGSASSTRRSSSSATRRTNARWPTPTTAVVTTGGGTPSGVLLLQRDRR